MGLFDYVRCQYPLPVAGANAMEFQSKDTPQQYCEWYEIRGDGTLWHEDYDTEDRSDPNAEGLMALAGSATRVNKRFEQCLMTGEVRFYTGTGPPDDGWLEFSAYFVEGKLLHLQTISDGTVDYFGKPIAVRDPLQALHDNAQELGAKG